MQLTLGVCAALWVGCAKGQGFDRDGLVYLDPRLPTPMADASAEAGREPPDEVPPETPMDASTPPPIQPQPDAGDSGSPTVVAEAGPDASPDGG